ncbi:HutD family protein [Rhizobium sp. YIM 134829]|uniref:HutD/Ves family protein n=1 Tax=Rhizobium sp. YIM 134829 TaxID=3390453 RepID=UPI00397B1B51
MASETGVTILRSANHRRMPWKNGGGETMEIAVHPTNSGLEDFGWRVSMARVESDGHFSLFPGIDRTLALLEGDGMALAIDGAAERLVTPATEPLTFPADRPTEARLVGGPILDLNVMTRRGLWDHSVTHLSLAGPHLLTPRAELTLLLALAPIEIDAHGKLDRLDAALLSTPVHVAAEQPASVYLIALTPSARRGR